MPQRPVFHAELGAYFTGLRERLGWTQRQAAAIARRRNLPAIGRQSMWRLESGKVKNPEPDVLRAVSELYGVPYEDLVARCVESQYDIEMRPTKPGAPRPEVVVAAFDPDEQRVLKAFRRVKSAKQRHAIILTVEAMASPDSKRRTKEPPQQ